MKLADFYRTWKVLCQSCWFNLPSAELSSNTLAVSRWSLGLNHWIDKTQTALIHWAGRDDPGVYFRLNHLCNICQWERKEAPSMHLYLLQSYSCTLIWLKHSWVIISVLFQNWCFSLSFSFSLIHINAMFVWLRFSGTETFKLKWQVISC